MEEENGSITRPFPNRSRPLFQSKARWKFIDLKMIFYAVADPGEGPGGPTPLIFRPNGSPKGRKFFLRGGGLKYYFFGDRLPLSQGLDDRPHPLSEGLNPPLYFHANKTHFHMKSFALSLVLKVRMSGIRKWLIMHRKRREI